MELIKHASFLFTSQHREFLLLEFANFLGG